MKIKPTKQQEIEYKRKIVDLVLKPLQGEIIKRLSRVREDATAWKLEIERAFTDFDYQQSVDNGSEKLANEHVESLETWHYKKTQQQFKKLFGIDVIPLLNQSNTRAFLDPIITANIQLIKSISPKLLDQVDTYFQTILRTEGFKRSVILNMLTQRFGVADSRAKVIARDQTSKTIGALTEYRQRQARVKKFIWRTSEDERVRPEHVELDGKVFDWDNPPDIGIPGQPIQCRCVAIPYLESFNSI